MAVDAATIAIRPVAIRPVPAKPTDDTAGTPEVETEQVEAVLADGRRLTADLLVVACGVRPCTTLAEQAGLGVDRGILVDDRMRTTDRDVFAIGDCAQHANVLSGLVAPRGSRPGSRPTC